MPQRSKKEHIVSVANQLFHKNGFNATGVEKVRDSANVSKKTLYNHFRSKDDLILAVLRREDEMIRNWLMQAIGRIGKEPKARLVGIFDAYIEVIEGGEFKGCLFIKAAAEFSDPENQSRAFSKEAKRLVRQLLKQLAVDLGVSDPDTLSSRLNILLQGAIVQAQVAGDPFAIQLAREMAIDLIEEAAPK